MARRSNLSTARALALSIVNDVEYRENLLERAREGDLSPQVEALLWNYAFGKPVDQIHITSNEEDLSELDDRALLERLRALEQELTAASVH